MARRIRYQQGIGIESPNVPYTIYKEPEAPPIQRWDLPRVNAGVSRNYGSTSKYVDTLPHRWEPGKWEALNTFSRRLRGDTSTGVSNAMARSATSRRLASPLPQTTNVPSGPSTPPPGSFPAPSGQGLAVPPAPSVRRAPSPLPGMPPVDSPGAKFMEKVRNAPAEPFVSPRDPFLSQKTDINPLPKGEWTETNPLPRGGFSFPERGISEPSYRFRPNRRPQ